MHYNQTSYMWDIEQYREEYSTTTQEWDKLIKKAINDQIIRDVLMSDVADAPHN